MALDPGKLKQQLVRIADQMPADPVSAGRAWAKAYATYAADAQSLGGGSPVGLDVAELAAGAAFALAFAPGNLPPTTAQQMAAALTVFWLTPPVVFGTGLVTAVAGTAIVPQALLLAWGAAVAGNMTTDQSMGLIANVLHTFTLTVITTTPGAPPIVGPVF